MTETLQRAADLYRQGLPSGEFCEFAIEGCDALRTGVHLMRSGLSRSGGPFVCGMGYGSSQFEAAVSARGELFEMITLADAAKEWTHTEGTFEEVDGKEGFPAIDPYGLVLPVGLDDVDRHRFVWTDVRNLLTDETFWAPIEFVASSRAALPSGYQAVTPPISNGNGAGDSEARGITHGLLELCQRDGNASSFRALDQGRILENPPLDPDTAQLVARLQERGFTILFKLADLSVGIPSVYAIPVVEGEDNPLAMTACGEAADPDLPLALRKALLEALAARARKVFSHDTTGVHRHYEPSVVSERAAKIDPAQEEPRAVEAMQELLALSPRQVRERLESTVYRRDRTFPSSSLDTARLPNEPEDRVRYMLDRLQAENMTAYAKTVRRGDAYAAKVLVPGIEMELASFYRLGVRGARRLLERGDPLLRHQPGPGRQKLTLRPEQEAELGGPLYLDKERLDRITAPLYFLYREPTPGVTRVMAGRRDAA
ncbi:YcaO-like family protein [Parvularcula maris]|uniref:YcaO-like family protein n=1 Tax=Parvularcula maris TaxID=2965077 RepID=A0A9X2RI79_9PROT|nr:YcaO-like family protein [Parvularcula maris]MCQ8184666.1 YcaO-like family protein [Parvularcula maris]